MKHKKRRDEIRIRVSLIFLFNLYLGNNLMYSFFVRLRTKTEKRERKVKFLVVFSLVPSNIRFSTRLIIMWLEWTGDSNGVIKRFIIGPTVSSHHRFSHLKRPTVGSKYWVETWKNPHLKSFRHLERYGQRGDYFIFITIVDGRTLIYFRESCYGPCIVCL